MPPPADDELLSRFRTERSEAAFRALVERHLPLVWSVARRVVNGDDALAEDVAQTVFADLARTARVLPAGVRLGGWLHRHTFFTASKAVRTEARRRAREIEAAAMNAASAPENDLWREMAPYVDSAIAELASVDRDAIVLRFFEKKPLRDVARVLGISEDAAGKRIARALERLRRKLLRRRVVLAPIIIGGSSGENAVAERIAESLAQNAIAAPPAHLSAAVATGAWSRAGAAAGGGGVLATIWSRVATPSGLAAGVTALLLAGTASLWWKVVNSRDPTASGRAAALSSPAIPPSPQPLGPPVQVTLTIIRVTNKSASLWLLRRSGSAGDEPFFQQLKSGGGRIEREMVLEGRAGSTLKAREMNDFEYGTEFTFDAAGAPSPTATEARGVGTEVTARVRVNQTDDRARLDLAFEHHFSPPTMHRWPVELVPGPDPIGPDQPEFHTAEFDTGLLVRLGTPALLGVIRIPAEIDPQSAGIDSSLFIFATVAKEGDSAESVSGASGHSSHATERNAAVHVTTFRVPELTIGLDTIAVEPTEEPALFSCLVEMVGQDEAEITFDQFVTAVTDRPVAPPEDPFLADPFAVVLPPPPFSRIKASAITGFVFPTEYNPVGKLFQLQPAAFDTRNLGTGLEFEVHASNRGAVEIMLDHEHVSLGGLHPWPVPNIAGVGGAASGSLPLPIFHTHGSQTAVTCRSGVARLIDVCRPPDAWADHPGGAPQKSLVTFLRMTLEDAHGPVVGSNDRAEADIIPTLRHHAIGVRAPRDEAALWMWQRDQSDDARALDWWLDQARSGNAKVMLNASSSTQSRRGYNVKSLREFYYPSQWTMEELIPDAFESRVIGQQVEMEPTIYQNEIHSSLDLGDFGPPHPWHRPVDSRNPQLTQAYPEFPHSDLSTSLIIPAGGVRFVGAASATPAIAAPGIDTDATDLFFLKAAGSRIGEAASATPLVEVQAMLISIPDGATSEVETAVKDPAQSPEVVSRLIDDVKSGRAHVAGQVCILQRSGQHSRIKRAVERVTEEAVAVVPSRPTVLSAAPHDRCDTGTFFECGTLIDANGPTLSIGFNFKYHAAPPEHLGIEAMLAIAAKRESQSTKDAQPASDGSSQPPRPVATHREFREDYASRERLELTSGEPRIVDVRPAVAPVSTPEAGRWHALVLRATIIK